MSPTLAYAAASVVAAFLSGTAVKAVLDWRISSRTLEMSEPDHELARLVQVNQTLAQSNEHFEVRVERLQRDLDGESQRLDVERQRSDDLRKELVRLRQQVEELTAEVVALRADVSHG